jgi:hypothetical protein
MGLVYNFSAFEKLESWTKMISNGTRMYGKGVKTKKKQKVGTLRGERR